MSLAAEEGTTNFYTNPDNDSESSENFQKFITELFEKNGVLNDLRAYLRGHIVNVLKSAETGAHTPCQKHFTRRLELVYQALNMLIAEYLLRLEFSYSLSVFVSEIPLANMVFDLARSLLRTTASSSSALRFNEKDVWSVLHNLGIMCDSAHASKILETYKNGDSPLLYCILQCIPLHQKEPTCYEEGAFPDCLTSSDNSAESYKRSKASHRNIPNRCRHYACCKSCQHRVLHLKERYKKRKLKYEKNANHSSINSLNVQSLMNNIAEIEKGLLDEMFQQLKAVYETEVAMVREEEEARVKRSIATHALQLQRQREQLEESFKARQAELERSVHQKKKFLWGLARALRSQHEHMSAAMKDVQYETRRLTEKESSIKSQLDEAEQILKKRGEEMRNQISQELLLLDAQLENMKRERDSINKEREELERLRDTYERTSKVMKQSDSDENGDLKMHYNSLKDEMVVLRRYIESTKLESKIFMERGTVMELGDGVMNNSVDVRGDDDDDRLKASQVVNDLKKRKNVNFSQSNLDEIYRQLSRTPSRSLVDNDSAQRIRGSLPDCDTCNRTSDVHRNHSCDSDVHRNHSCDSDVHRSDSDVHRNHSSDSDVHRNHSCDSDVHRNHSCDSDVHRNRSCDSVRCRGCNLEDFVQLHEENERLKTFSRQQREHIDALLSERARLQTRLNTRTRPLTAPSVLGANVSPGRMIPTTSSRAFGWLKGAGEESNVYCTSAPRVVLPGDELPFVGALSERRGDSRRALISQWQAVRRRLSPHARPRALASLERSAHVVAANTEESRNGALSSHDGETQHQNIDERPQPIQPELKSPREKSPKSLLREAKEKLRNSNVSKEPPAPREKSPTAVLREAKMRLRKLEIEAEAVQQSYLDFRQRQTALREERHHLLVAESSLMNSAGQLEIEPTKTLQRPNATENMPTDDALRYDHSQNLKKDFNKYLREYQTNYDIGRIHFYNRNSAAQQIKPIPHFSEISENNEPTKTKNDYLETPLTEFRKLYQTQKIVTDDTKLHIPILNPNKNPQNNISNECAKESKKLEAFQKIKNNKQAELEILKENVKKMYLNVPGISSHNTGLIEEQGITENIENSDTKMENLEKVDPKNMHKLENYINADTNLEVELPQNVAVKDNVNIMLEVENVRETRNLGVTESKNDLLLVVESKVASKDRNLSENNEQKISTQMTIIVSPKSVNSPKDDLSPSMEISKGFAKLTNNTLLDNDNDGKEQPISTQMTIIVSPKSVNSPKDDLPPSRELSKDFTELTNNALIDTDNDGKEQTILTQMTINVSPESVNSPKDSSLKELSENLTKQTNKDALNAFYRAENNKELSNVDMQSQIKDLESEVEKDQEEIGDDFSADVDYYNSLSDSGENSPISLPKTSEDENFWDN